MVSDSIRWIIHILHDRLHFTEYYSNRYISISTMCSTQSQWHLAVIQFCGLLHWCFPCADVILWISCSNTIVKYLVLWISLWVCSVICTGFTNSLIDLLKLLCPLWGSKFTYKLLAHCVDNHFWVICFKELFSVTPQSFFKIKPTVISDVLLQYGTTQDSKG